MTRHTAEIFWQFQAHPEDEKTYSRDHVAVFRGDQRLRVSAAETYKGSRDCGDPEQLLLSAVASCHMLTFLAIAEMQGLKVESYKDRAQGRLEKVPSGKMAITHISLAPQVTFAEGFAPDEADLKRLHHSAHKNCFIGNSLNATIDVAS
ncbi:OsmC family protein [Brucella intermedia GD04153]|uniref:OsmC family protein n=1 Tax=Brucella intermedia GD04153 TaxID=2975438 RepID=A0AA42H1C9_9HYPH|nr:OsmC family protein [Brucella intermedia]MDH0126856.1 OsmC family protein [Brucella intermedia GD04153]RRD22395.1 OsmC family peroxiredoxin [Brucellaceae bacterium VT-16-1752]